MAQIFRYRDGAAPNIAALAVTVLGFPAAVAMLGAASWWLNAAGLALLVLTLTWSAYYIHEFAHHAIFKSPTANERWGMLMRWINGSCYASFADLRRKHMRHHIERADVLTFDVRGFLLQSPAWLRATVLALEWAYIPAVEFLMRGFVIALPFRDPSKAAARGRIVGVAILRLGAFALLAWWSLKALALYALGYLIFVTLLRFADCFQHTYDSYPILGDQPIPNDKLRDRAYEQANTYTNVVGLNNPILNLVWLNFGYHNAHHERPTVPWHQLPAFHRSCYGQVNEQVVTMPELLRAFHRHRLRRVLSGDYGAVLPRGTPHRADGFVGAVGVSFLTAV